MILTPPGPIQGAKCSVMILETTAFAFMEMDVIIGKFTVLMATLQHTYLVGTCRLYWHNFEHNRHLKVLNIMLA